MYKQVVGFIVRLGFVVLLYGIVLFVTRKNPHPEQEEIEDKMIHNIDMDNEFIKETETKKTVFDFAKIYSIEDLIVIRSILYSCGINSFIQFFNMCSLRPGVGVDNYTDMRLSIFEDDSEEVKIIIQEYENRKIEDQKVKLKTKVRNIVEAIIGNWIVEESKSARSIEIMEYI